MNDIEKQIKESVNSFLIEVDRLIGFYLDSRQGFKLNVDMMNQIQIDSFTKMHGRKPIHGETLSEFDNNRCWMFSEKMGSKESVVLNSPTQGDFKKRNSDKGENRKVNGQNLIVLIYTQWEDRHRQKLADLLSIDKGTVLIPIFGDLGKLRHDVVHNKGFISMIPS